MAWTNPSDRLTGDVITAAQWNALLGTTGSLAQTDAAKVTTAGDIVYATAANTLARLGIGSSAQVLTVSGGIPAWASPAADFTTIDKAATETVNNSTTLQSDDDFFFTAAASTDYLVEIVALLASNTQADFKIAWTLTGMTWDGTYEKGMYDGTEVTMITHEAVTSGSGKLVEIGNPILSALWRATFVIHSGSTGGTCYFQWAQQTATVTNTSVRKNSQMNYKSLGST